MENLFVAVERNLDAVYLIYGLAFFVLGAIVLAQPRAAGSRLTPGSVGLIGAFGLIHGTAEWVELWSRMRGSSVAFEAAGVFLLGVSLLLLFEFGRRLCAEAISRFVGPAGVVGAWIYGPVAVGVAVASLLSPDRIGGLAAGLRYFLGFTGALMTAAGFLFSERSVTEPREKPHPATNPYLWAALGFGGYAIVGGLVVGHGDLSSPAVLHEASFLAAFGLPVQLFRAGCAVLALAGIVRILRLAQLDAGHRLRWSLQQAEGSLADLGRLDTRNRQILESAGRGIFGTDPQGRLIFINSLGAELLGYEPADLIGRRMHRLVHHTLGDGSPCSSEQCPIDRTLRSGAVHHVDDDVFWRRDRRSFPVEYTSTPMREAGKIVGTVVSFRDTTAKKQAEEHLRLAAMVFENIPEGVLITDGDGVIQSVNPGLLATTGYSREELVGQTPNVLRSAHHAPEFYAALWATLREKHQWQGEIWNRRRNGEIYPEWLSVNALRNENGDVTHYVGIYSDIRTHQDVQQRLHHLAYYDALTGLPNRQLFADRLGLALAQARRESQLVGLMFLDLDRFKNINDSLGHSIGDRLLEAVADRLRETVREVDTIARIGGDEFTVILPGLHAPRHAGRVARKILASFSPPFSVEGREFYLSGSIGISVSPHDGEDLESLTRKADIAMYRAKDLGRNNYQFYRPDMSVRFQQHLALENDLRRALERDELYLVYQPQIDIRNGKLVGVEALARWRHPEHGELSPNEFIPIAEETGLIDRLGEWGLRTACRQAHEWMLAGGEFRVAVNLSPHQVRRGGIAELVADVLHETGLPPSSLALELTESVLMDHSETSLSALNALVGMGVQIAIDDFGTGYSSLSYIKRFSIDKLKIDKSFVRDIPDDANDRALAAMIIAMAHASNMRVTAEGVERPEQLEYLREQGCDEMQGFLVSRPVPASNIPRLLARATVM